MRCPFCNSELVGDAGTYTCPLENCEAKAFGTITRDALRQLNRLKKRKRFHRKEPKPAFKMSDQEFWFAIAGILFFVALTSFIYAFSA